jgi:hypothetical protein
LQIQPYLYFRRRAFFLPSFIESWATPTKIRSPMCRTTLNLRSFNHAYFRIKSKLISLEFSTRKIISSSSFDMLNNVINIMDLSIFSKKLSLLNIGIILLFHSNCTLLTSHLIDFFVHTQDSYWLEHSLIEALHEWDCYFEFASPTIGSSWHWFQSIYIWIKAAYRWYNTKNKKLFIFNHSFKLQVMEEYCQFQPNAR